MNKKIIGGTSALAVGIVGAGVYLAIPASAGASPKPATTANAGKNATAKKHGRHPLRAARGIHGEATVRTKKGFTQADWQRGTLTAANGGTLTVRSLDGVTWQWKTAKGTRVRKDGSRSAVSKLATGDSVVVVGRNAGGTRTAKIVVVPKRVKGTKTPAPSHS